MASSVIKRIFNFPPKGPMAVNANNLLTPNDNGVYRNTSGTISNCPEADGTLIVMNNGGGNSTVQMFVSSSGNKLYIRTQWGAGGTTWTNWSQH